MRSNSSIRFPRWSSLCIMVVATMWPVRAQDLEIVVSNLSTADRVAEPIFIQWAEITRHLGGSDLASARLVDEHGRSLPFQVDDLDMDGTPDELTFVASCAARSSRTFWLRSGADSLPSPIGPPRTDARTYRRVDGRSVSFDDDDDPGSLRKDSHYPFDGVGWESEVIGYRLYLDERNAIDIQAKRIPGLHWDFIGRTGVNYQLDAWWGMDVLHVGPSFGFGGIALWDGTRAVKPERLERRRTRIVSRGPVRTVVRVEYTGWMFGSDQADLTSVFLQYADDRIMEHRVSASGRRSPVRIATGIVRHAASLTSLDTTSGLLSSHGLQSRDGGNLSMVLAFPPALLVRSYQTDVDDAIVLSVPEDGPLRMYLSARWDGEQDRKPARSALGQDIAAILARTREPMIVSIYAREQ